jgi:transcriptional regulator with XRE-family HTH domain
MSVPTADPYRLGIALRDARKVKGWTQQQLADRAGVSRQLIIDLERGRRPRAELSRVLALARALGLGLALEPLETEPFDSALDRALGQANDR